MRYRAGGPSPMLALLLFVASAHSALAADETVVLGSNEYYKPLNQSWHYEISYATVPGVHCTRPGMELDALPVSHLAYPVQGLSGGSTVQAFQCHTRCSTTPSAPECTGFCSAPSTMTATLSTVHKTRVCPAADSAASKALCASVSECKSLCEATPYCYGFDVLRGADRCFLLHERCQEKLLTSGLHNTMSDLMDYVAKMDPERRGRDEGCAEGLWIDGEGMRFSSLNVRYPVEQDYWSFAWNLTNPVSARVRWHHSGCGWVVEMEKQLATLAAAPVCMAASCSDQNTAANWIFGQSGSTFEPGMCRKTRWWLEAGYCSNALWRSLCPDTCSVPCTECTAWANADAMTSADVITEMMELTTPGETSCATLKRKNMCSDHVVKVVCKGTCWSTRRLSEEETAPGPVEQRLLDFARGTLRRRLHAELSTAEEGALAERRRLGIDGDFEEIYSSFDPTDAAETGSKSFGCRSEAWFGEIAPMTANGLYDWHAYNRAVPAHERGFSGMSHICPMEDSYTTSPGVYCNDQNIVVRGHQIAAVREHQCYAKCLSGNVDNFGKSGPTHGYCDGNDASFNEHSNALCLDRQQCETICDSLQDCFAIEMHRTKPRCYLNKHACTLGSSSRIESSSYDLLVKKPSRQDYSTHFLQTCSQAESLSSAAEVTASSCAVKCAPGAATADSIECKSHASAPTTGICEFRDRCEELCENDVSCSGFKMHASSAQCFTYRGTACDPAVTNSLSAYTAGGEWHYVHKLAVRSCFVRMEEAPSGYDAWEGDYAYDTASPSSAPVFKKGTTEIRYMAADSYRGNKCPSWHVGEPNAYVFRTVGNLTAAECPPVASPITQALEADKMYWVRPPLRSDAALKLACGRYSSCPLLSTCVLAESRFRTEMLLQYSTTSSQLDALKATPLYTLSASDLVSKVGDFAWKPKVLVSVDRTTAFVSRSKWEHGKDLFRNVPGSNRVNLVKPNAGHPWDKLVISLASAIGSPVSSEFGSNAQREFARSAAYDVPTGFGPWYTDVIRLEIYDKLSRKMASPVQLEIYAPLVPQLHCFHFDSSASSVSTHVGSSVGGDFTVERSDRNGDYFMLNAKVSGDYICTSELSCTSAPPNVCTPTTVADGSCKSLTTDEELSECANKPAGSTCEINCARARKKAADWMCVGGAWKKPSELTNTATTADGSNDCVANDYVAEEPYFRLTHRSRLDYGWKIFSVKAFNGPECGGTEIPITMVQDSGNYVGKTNAPSYLLANADNENSGLYWWSKCLNCNPYEVDETHGSRAWIDFVVSADKDVQSVCVKSVSQLNTEDRSYYPTVLELSRGWRRDGQSSLGNPQIFHVDGWTDQWVYTKKEPETIWGVQAAIQSVPLVKACLGTQCGMKDKIVFGELLKFPNDVVKNVPSSCHCKQLCVDNIENGCVSWKYRYSCPPSTYTGYCSGAGCANTYIQGCEVKTCFLQRTISSVSGGEWGRTTCTGDFTGFMSGGTGLRLTGVEPRVISPNTDFELEVKGVNFPAKVDLHEVMPTRQRVKLVEKGEPCAEGMPAMNVKGIACPTAMFCSPMPVKTSADSATWEKLSVQSGKSDKDYTVCYNMGFTHDRWQWYAVPGDVKVRSHAFTWASEPGEIYRKQPTMNITITRAAFATYSNPSDWRIKLVRDAFACDLNTDPKITGGNATNSTSFLLPTKAATDSATFADLTVYTTEANVGLYQVCFSENGTEGKFVALAGSDGETLHLNIEAEDGDSSHPREVFGHQRWSARTGTNNNVTLKGFSLMIPSAGRIAVIKAELGSAILGNGACATAEIVNASFPNITKTSNGTNTSVLGPVTTMLFDVDSKKSTQWGYYVDADLTLQGPPGRYEVCYCDGNADTSLENVTGSYTFQPTENKKMSTAGSKRLAASELTGASGKDYSVDECWTKCSRGCAAMNCFCDGYDQAKMTSNADASDSAAPLCLSPVLCKAACEDIAGCKGIDTHTSLPLCYLSKGETADLVKDEDYDHWDKAAGKACQENGDFSKKIGEMFVTSRASRENDWIFEPEKNSMIELTGNDLNWFKDRVMVIDREATCGMSATTGALELPTAGTGFSSQYMWNHWVAVPDFHFVLDGFDAPSNSSEPIYMPPVATPTSATYDVKRQFYCPGGNVDIRSHPAAAEHQCYQKCTVNAPCDTHDCFCNGQYAGYDGPSSNALCLNSTLCRSVCTSMGDSCYGIDMHRSKDRCFLNMQTPCKDYVVQDGLAPEATYDFYYKVAPNVRRMEGAEAVGVETEELRAPPVVTEIEVDGSATQRNAEGGQPLGGRRLLAPTDTGYSWDQILRFQSVRFRGGGTFKVCFCDHTLLKTTGSVCAERQDYSVEVGQIHVSGVYCLVRQTRYQRGICVPQYPGDGSTGMRCYKNPPKPPTLTIPAGTPSKSASSVVRTGPTTAPTVSTWCLYGPEEETRDHPACKLPPNGA